jgi:DNA-binding MarR family transcriptional regulator
MGAVGQLRRAVRRQVRQGFPHRPLVESEVELVRLVHDRPGLRIQEAAATLGLAPNTVSTLVTGLTRKGLLERRRDYQDGRAARLALTAEATRRIAAWRDRREQIVAEAILRLAPEDRASIRGAVPSLYRLIEQVEME